MNPLLRRRGGIWIGWSGDTGAEHAEERRAVLQQWAGAEHCFAIDLPADVATGFYQGYANQTLWPVFHYFPSQLKFDEKAWEAYVEANRIFCHAVVDQYQPGDMIWVHDYHLLLLPEMLREALPDAAIGFFLHIPFPSPEIFPILPRREELLRGLLGADLLAFQTHGHLQQFRSSLLRVLGIESRVAEVAVGGRAIRLEALPIGIAPEEYTRLLEGDQTTAQHYSEWVARYTGQKVLLAVDRLDYTKGVPERLRAYARLLRSETDLKEKTALIQIAVPTREGIDTYQDLRTEVNQLVGEINGKLGTPDWTPVVYINRAIEREELVALYKLAAVCWVGPLRDGMNLVSKEYVACKGEGDGVLVLSEFAGAAAEMGEALLINPFDEDRTAAVVARALALDERERQDRMRALHGRVTRNNVFHWGDRFLAALEEAASARGRYADTQPKRLRIEEIQQAYVRANRRLLILDYDGTLIPFADLPQQATPPPAVLRILAALASDPNNCVALTSGRRARDMDQWFGTIEGLWLIAEHGAELKRPGSSSWEALRAPIPADWKSSVMPILEHFVDRTPGSFVEEKEYSLVWHHRLAEPEFGAWLANELVSMLEAMLAETELRAYRGANIVEVKPVWANKGEAFERLRLDQPRADFLLAVGDDRTDEDLFERMRDGAWTVHVGPGYTCAAFVAPDFESVRRLLGMFTEVHAAVSRT
jgi:trehalose 6-phosphate synthase/phosphatase